MAHERFSNQVLHSDFHYLDFYRRPRQKRLGNAVIFFDTSSRNQNNDQGPKPEDPDFKDSADEYWENPDTTRPWEHRLSTDKSLQQAMASRQPKTDKPRKCFNTKRFPANRMPVRDSLGCHLKYRQTLSELRQDEFRYWEFRHSPEYNHKQMIPVNNWIAKLPSIQLTKRIEDNNCQHGSCHCQVNTADDARYTGRPMVPINPRLSLNIVTAESNVKVEREGGDDALKIHNNKDPSDCDWAHAGDHCNTKIPDSANGDNLHKHLDVLNLHNLEELEDRSDFIRQYLTPIEEGQKSMRIAMFGQGIQASDQTRARGRRGHYFL